MSEQTLRTYNAYYNNNDIEPHGLYAVTVRWKIKMVDLLTSRRSLTGKNVGWLQDSEDNGCALNGISKTDVPSVNEQISELVRIICKCEETTDEVILKALQYYVRNLPFSRAGTWSPAYMKVHNHLIIFRNVLCDTTSTCHLPDYHEATKIPNIVQDRYNDDIYPNICYS